MSYILWDMCDMNGTIGISHIMLLCRSHVIHIRLLIKHLKFDLYVHKMLWYTRILVKQLSKIGAFASFELDQIIFNWTTLICVYQGCEIGFAKCNGWSTARKPFRSFFYLIYLSMLSIFLN